MRSSVRTRITLIATAVVAVALVVAAWLILQLVEQDFVETTERALAAELELEATQFGEIAFGGEELFFFDFFVEERPLSLGMFTIAEEGVAFGELYEQGFLVGDVFIDLDEVEVIEIIDPLSGLPIQDPELIAELEEAAFEVREIESELEGEALLVGAVARDEVNESLEAVRDALILIVPALVVVMGLLIWFLVGRALRPVGAMSERVEAITTTSLDQRVPVPSGRDEVSNLATVMNGMLDRLQRGDHRQRQFAADASHELRSPLSTVRAAAEIIEHNPASGRTESLAHDIVHEADRMDRLIGDLLHLSRVDEDRASDQFETIDLGQLVADSARGVNVTTEPGLIVLGSADQLRRVVENLVVNAQRHATEQVSVCAGPAANGRVEVRVDDDGPGVPANDRERIFERFSRLDAARSRDRGGAGLGLALVKAIVTRHQGQVHVETSPSLGGASFVVRLPRGQSTPHPSAL